MWQMRMPRGRAPNIPRLSFVVATTHSRLGCAAGRGVRGRGAARVQRDIHPGRDQLNRVLFSGVEHVDKVTREMLAAHRRMLEQGVARDDPERTEIEGRLRGTFGDVGEAPSAAKAWPVAPLQPRSALLGHFLEKKG